KRKRNDHNRRRVVRFWILRVPVMPALITFGRILFAVLFVYTGATKLLAIPALLAPYLGQLESMTGMTTPQMLAIGVGAFEVIAGLMIALNVLARFFA